MGARERKEVRGAIWVELLVRKSSSLVSMEVAIVVFVFVLISFVWLSRCDDLVTLGLRFKTNVDGVCRIRHERSMVWL